MNHNKLISLIIYRVILPLSLFFIFFVEGERTLRSSFLGTNFTDTLTRLLIFLFYAGSFWTIPPMYLDDRPAYKKFFWRSLDRGSLLRIFYTTNILVFSILAGFMFKWAIRVFVPSYSSISNYLAFMISMMYFLPVFLKYDLFREKLYADNP